MFIRLLCRKRHKKKFLIPLMNEGAGELRCRKHFFIVPFGGIWNTDHSPCRRQVIHQVAIGHIFRQTSHSGFSDDTAFCNGRNDIDKFPAYQRNGVLGICFIQREFMSCKIKSSEILKTKDFGAFYYQKYAALFKK